MTSPIKKRQAHLKICKSFQLSPTWGLCSRSQFCRERKPSFHSLMQHATCFHQLINENSLNQAHSLLSDYMISVLLLEIQRENQQMPKAAVANRMLEYIRLHCFEKLALSDLSAALGYSEDYLSRLFHEHVKCSFRQYIHRLRMQRATKELLSSVKTIQQIAAECGYNNAKFFSTAFMKCEGISPSAYRNMYGGLHQNNA